MKAIANSKPTNIVYVFGPKVSNALPNDIMDFKLGMCKNNEVNFNQRLNEHKRHCHNGICHRVFETESTDGPINRWLKKTFPERAITQGGVGHEMYRTTVENFHFLVEQVTKYVNGKNTGREKTNTYKPRKEQVECISKTIAHMKSPENIDRPFLWNCKMRFGKTFTLYQLIMKMDVKNALIITRRPTDTKNAWIDDTDHVDFDFGPNDIIDSSKQIGSIVLKENGRNIVLVSFQDLDDLSKPKFKDVVNAKWDIIAIDEAHFGANTEKAKRVISKFNRKYPLLYLSGTPFKMLEEGTQFDSTNTYTWSYVDEQKTRQQEITSLGNEEAMKTGQYYWLPKMQPYVIDIADGGAFSEAALFSDDEGFTFTKLFSFETVNNKLQFKNQRFVNEFLDYLCQPKMPYGHQAHLTLDKIDTQHTIWYVPGVKEGHLLKGILEKHRVFKDFDIVPAYGDNEGMSKDTVALVKQKVATINIIRKKGTITLSCGKLTHGVSIPEWGSVFVLSDLASPQEYFQLIFRGQTSRKQTNNRPGKEICGVFDFSPNRTLNHYYELAKATSKNGDIQSSLREVLSVMNPICFNGNELKLFSIEDILNNFKFGYASRGVFTNFFRNIQADIDQDLLDDINGFATDVSKNKKIEIGDHKIVKGKNSRRIDDQDRNYDSDESDNLSEASEKEKQELTEDQAKKIVSEGLARIPLLLKICAGDTMEEVLNQIDDSACRSLSGLTLRNFKSILLGKKNAHRQKEINTIVAKFRAQEKLELNRFFNDDCVQMGLHDQLPNPRFNPGDSFEIVKTPSKLANKMLDEFPIEIWTDETKKWLIPVSKSGIFELQIYRRLMNGLKEKLPNKNERRDHIMQNMIWSFCPTSASLSLTYNYFVESVYGIQYEADVKSNVHQLDILNDRDVVIHTNGDIEMKKQGKCVKFDVIIGNPPYQSNSGNTSDKALYPAFVQKAIKARSEYISMVIPSKWMTGDGKGTKEFLQTMLNCKQLSKIITVENAREWFPDIDLKGGAMYFLLDTNKNGNKISINGYDFDLNDSDIIITDKIAISIKNKVLNKCTKFFGDTMYGQNPYGINTNHKQWTSDKNDSYVCHCSGGSGRGSVKKLISKELVVKNLDTIRKWKLCIAKNSGAGKDGTGHAFISAPNAIITQSYLLFGCFDTEQEAKNAHGYLCSMFAQFMSSILKSAQNVSKRVFKWLPYLDFSRSYTDQDLYEMFELSAEEISHIENYVKDFPIFRNASKKEAKTK